MTDRIVDRVSFTSPQNSSPFTVTSTGSQSIPDGVEFSAKIYQSSDPTIYADVQCLVSSGQLFVNLVTDSSGANKNALPTFAGGVVIFSSANSQSLSDSLMDVEYGVAAFGQSNMSLRDDNSFDELLDTDHNVYQTAQRGTYDGQYIKSGPLYFSDQYQNNTQSTGIAGHFSRAFSRFHGDRARIRIIPVAEGGTGFVSGWRKGGLHYNRALAACNDFINEREGNKLSVVLVHLGEEDTLQGNAAFASDLHTFIADFRNDIVTNETNPDHSKLPFIFGGLLPEYVSDQGADGTLTQNALSNVITNVANTGFADSTGATHTGDRVHITAEFARTFGVRYFDAWKFARSNDLTDKVPNQVARPTATPGNAQVTVDWLAPIAVPAITGYSLQWRANGGAPATVPLGNVLTHNITGLTNDDTIDVRIAAVNSEGTGAYSPWSRGVVPSAFATIQDNDPYMFLLQNQGITTSVSNVTEWTDRDGRGSALTQTVDANRPSVDGDGALDFGGNEWLVFPDDTVLSGERTILVMADLDATLGHNLVSGSREFFFISGAGDYARGTGSGATLRVQTSNDPGTGEKVFWLTVASNGESYIGWDQGGAGNEAGPQTDAIVAPSTAGTFLGRHNVGTGSMLTGKVRAVVIFKKVLSVTAVKACAQELTDYIASL